MSDKIILLGFMGCGKSTIGKTLAKQLSYKFVDLDDEIEKAENTTISKIFEDNGEAYFRKLESKILKTTLREKGNVVVAMGGGTPCHNGNMKWINKYTSFYIRCGVDVLTKRLSKEKSHRPIIAHKKKNELKRFISKKLSERRVFYNQADHVLVGSRPVINIVSRVITLLG